MKSSDHIARLDTARRYHGLAAACLVLTLLPHALQAQEPATPQWRPALHFSPAEHWMNDPNGPFFLDGTYHLFYQYNPAGMVWGPMSWGHATSTDLLHWHEESVAIRSTPNEDIFSGTVVYDSQNRSGLGSNATPPLLAFHTSVFHGDPAHPDDTQAQSLSYSLDGGAHWQAYEHNPILTLEPESRQFRDPSVVWYPQGQCWIMTTVVADAQLVKFYRSTDLLHWSFLSDFQPSGYRKPGMLWEMPLLIPLSLDGNPHDPRWVMIVSVNPWSIAGGSGVQYFVGRFDGTRFTPDALPPDGSDPSAYAWLDHGADQYATIRFDNTGTEAPLLIGWMNNWDYASALPTAPWRGQATLPVQLDLKTVDGRPTLTQTPTPTYEALIRRQGIAAFADRDLGPNQTWRAPMGGDVLDVRVTLHRGDATRAGIAVRQSPDGRTATVISYDFTSGNLTLDRSRSGEVGFSPRFSLVHIAHLSAPGGVLSLHVVVDRNSVELFANRGTLRMTDLVFPPAGSDRMSLFSNGGHTYFTGIRISAPAR
ncbi:glycoside hydrolase family 32 protein [Gluconacetobacter liquefaciens]|uniref:Glycoside hydrolase family 32 protein n=3 Tax=Gluconacetobacter liquefaciens TaxID=89584 RepID=A0A7W4PAD4_GLULI|nr:glycoside hydrolase family 32 protein [Gluconacetobacter liquefaciens]